MLGEKLLKMGVITQGQLDECLKEQATSGKKLGEVLVAKGYATQAQVDAALAK
jgi:endonuclease YncB( thermonuclease family)